MAEGVPALPVPAPGAPRRGIVGPAVTGTLSGSQDDEERPRCVVCGMRRPGEGLASCWRCLDKIRSLVVEVGERWPRLTSVPGKPGAGLPTGRFSPGFESQSPANDDAIVLTDKRSEDLSVEQLIKGWVEYVKPLGYTDVESGCRIVVSHLPRIAQTRIVAELHDEVLRVVRAMRRAMHDVKPPKASNAPGRMTLVSTRAIAEHYKITMGTVRGWASKDGWTPYGDRRHRRWDASQVHRSYRRRQLGIKEQDSQGEDHARTEEAPGAINAGQASGERVHARGDRPNVRDVPASGDPAT